MKTRVRMYFWVCVFFSLCCFSTAIESIESRLGKNSNPSPNSNRNQGQEQLSECSFKCEDFKALENDNRELKKVVEELKENFYTLRNELNELKNEARDSILEPLRGPPGEKGEAGIKGKKGQRGPIGLKGERGKVGSPGGKEDESGLTERPPIPDCLKEKWQNVHHQNNTEASDLKIVVTATVGVGFGVDLQNVLQPNLASTDYFYENSDESTQTSGSFLPAELFARIGKSNATGFDWTLAPSSIWTNETLMNKTYTCEAHSSCVLKQLVGQCEEFSIPVDKFCLVSVPVGSSIPESCKDSKFTSCSGALQSLASTGTEEHTIYPHGNGNSAGLEVLCDFETDGGGWTIIQKRSSGPKHEFDRTLNEYKNGFGSLDGNFWLGLYSIRALTKNGDQELLIQLEDFEGNKRYAKYSNFSVSDASDFFRLSISGYSGDAGDSMSVSFYGLNTSNGRRFSTKDKNSDNAGYRCEAELPGRGGWWFNTNCSGVGLNGLYHEKGETTKNWEGIYWTLWKGEKYSLAKTEMKIRKRK